MRLVTPFLVSLLLPLTALTAQEKFTLRYAFQPGQVTWMQMTQDMTQDLSMAGRDTQMKMSSVMWLEGKVVEVKDGVAVIEQRYARLKVTGDNPMMKVDYDSDVEGSKPGAMRNLADLVGKTAKSKVDSSGKVMEFTMPGDLEGAMAPTGVSLKQGFEQQFTAWPKDPVGIGDTWQSSLEFPMDKLGSMKATITNKLLAMKDGVATVEQKMAMDTSGVQFPAGMTMEVPKSECVSKISLAAFQPVEATMDMVVKMTRSGNAPMNMTMGMRMTMKQVPAPAAKPAADAPKDSEKKEGEKK